MKHKFLLLMIIGIPYMLLSQLPDHSKPLKKNETKVVYQPNKLYFLATESFPLKVPGRHYLQSNFVEGTIIDFENEKIQVPLRYRFADDEMQIKHLDKIKALYPQKIKQIIFKIDNQIKTFIPTEYVEKKVKNIGYFELVSKGNITLLKAYHKKGKDGIKICYFVQKEGELAKAVKLKKSSILRVFGERKSDASKYVAKNKINIKSDAGLKKVFDYYNSLD